MLIQANLVADNRPLPLMQHPDTARALKRLGRDAAIVHLNDQAQALVIRQSFGPLGSVRFSSRGPVWSGRITRRNQSKILRAARINVLNADGMAHDVLQSAGYVRVVTPTHVAELPVADTPTAQLVRCKGKWRNAYRQGLRSDLSIRVRPFCRSKHAWLMQADKEQQRSKKFRNLPDALLIALHETSPGAVKVVTATSGAQVVAGMIFVCQGQVGTYHIGWTNAQGRAARAHHVMLMKAGPALGVSRLDLGTVNTVDAPGLARFKIGSGAVVRSLGGTWIRLPFR